MTNLGVKTCSHVGILFQFYLCIKKGKTGYIPNTYYTGFGIKFNKNPSGIQKSDFG